MTDQEWLACTDPASMLRWLRKSGKGSDRKLRLFAIACCRRVWKSLPKRTWDAVELWNAVELAEHYADCARGADPAGRRRLMLHLSGRWYALHNSFQSARLATRFSIWVLSSLVSPVEQSQEQQAQAASLRDLFDIPFRVLTFDPAWATPQVISRAKCAYEERHLPAGILDAGLLGALADELEKAGCRNDDVLGHLRQQNAVHVRGCWVVDLLLNKA